MDLTKLKEKIKQTAPVRIIVVSFVLVILVGTLLLCLPISSKGAPVSFLDAAFTATSATCVTGLALFDTFQTFTFFGQGIILLLIQIGGLGLATLVTAMTMLLRKKLAYKNLLIINETAGNSGLDMVSLLQVIMSFTFIAEILGASLLMLRFVPEHGPIGIWASFFIAVSAFCNAGFDVLGFIPGNVSICGYAGDPLVSFTIAGLIFVGGLGFLVVHDIYMCKILSRFQRKPRGKLSFHSQICLRVSGILLLIGTVAFFVLEFDNTMKDLNVFEKLIASIFQSTNTRTAGFASIDIAAENDITKLITVVLMFIGGSPGSTAGGIKVTTFIVLFATVMSTLRGKEETSILAHRFDKKVVYKALSVMTISLMLILLDLVVIMFFNKPGGAIDILLEATSAFGTVGLSANLTHKLNVVGKLMIMLTMFIGRVGPASLGIAILMRPKRGGETILPEGRMLIG